MKVPQAALRVACETFFPKKLSKIGYWSTKNQLQSGVMKKGIINSGIRSASASSFRISLPPQKSQVSDASPLPNTICAPQFLQYTRNGFRFSILHLPSAYATAICLPNSNRHHPVCRTNPLSSGSASRSKREPS